MDPSTPVEPPPPAYETEHDYDRKVSDALQHSLTISNPQPDGSEAWEEWDEARFAAAAAAARAREQGHSDEPPRPPISRQSTEKERLARQYAQSEQTSGEASSSTSPGPAAQSLNNSRRLPASPPATAPTKERPSWFAEAQLDTPAGSGSAQNDHATSIPQVHHVPPEEDDPDEPLPPFVAEGPSLEGPPFEEVVRQPPRLPPGSDADSPPQSPLDSVDESDGPPEPPPFSPPPGRRAYNDTHRHPTSPRQAPAPPMLRTSSIPSSSARPPPMRFDPSIAYTKQRNANLSSYSTEAESKEPVDASAFYNSAVSSYLGPSQHQTPKKSNALNREAPASAGAYRPSVHDPVPPLPQAPPLHHAAPAPNSYYPAQGPAYMPNQYAPYSQPQFQQPQQVAPAFYNHPFQGAAPGPPPPPPPPHWPPPHNNIYGGGYGR